MNRFSIFCSTWVIWLILFISNPAWTSGKTETFRAPGGLTIFLWFAAVNALIILGAIILKQRSAHTGSRGRQANKLRPDIAFTIRNDTIEIGDLFDKVREFGEDRGLTLKTIFDLVLVLEEMLSYVIANGFEEGQKALITVRFNLEKDRARLAVEYQGQALNPLEAPKIDINLPIEDLPLEGWDLHLLHLLVDDIAYERSGETNILRVVKQWQPNTPKEETFQSK